ncbi:MAG: 2-(1,2-epoxy-1,2-dihydrophenyl)acetyl-CoA isomerase [Ignavibacteria bacterium]|nr:2-(1,2-epoxy-1,2-dihydrophenyl)acetyl-CoA isomerase [Ignavibacteria bacterium]
MFSTVLYEIIDGVCIITFNRPEVYNAFNEQMKKDLMNALKEAEKDTAICCLVIRGAGEKAFCSGQDLKEYGARQRSLKESLENSYNPIVKKIRTMEKPIIAMINGVAAGAGCSIALACDMRIMSENAKMIEVFIRIGLVPDSGSHWFLPRLVGIAKAFEYAATGRDITAEEAARFGLVNKVVPGERLEVETMQLAKQLAKAPTKSIGYIKRTLNKALTSSLEELLEYEAIVQQLASETSDHKEGVHAFLEKREARFIGK